MTKSLDTFPVHLNGQIMKDIVQWDIKTWSKAIKFWDNNVDWNRDMNCLALGERKGGLALYLALKGKKVICSDLYNPQEIAEQLHTQYQVNHLITIRYSLRKLFVTVHGYFSLLRASFDICIICLC